LIPGPTPDGDGRELAALLAVVPEGWSRADVAGLPWAVTRTTHAGGKVISLGAEQLGGVEQFGANLWITSGGPILRPCEVPAEVVLRFFREAAVAYSERLRSRPGAS
jgi:peptide-methionine (S)-S-oxide reductase